MPPLKRMWSTYNSNAPSNFQGFVWETSELETPLSAKRDECPHFLEPEAREVRSVDSEEKPTISRFSKIRSSLSKRASKSPFSSRQGDPKSQNHIRKLDPSEVRQQRQNSVQELKRSLTKEIEKQTNQSNVSPRKSSRLKKLPEQRSDLNRDPQNPRLKLHGGFQDRTTLFKSKGKGGEVAPQTISEPAREATPRCSCSSWEAQCLRKPGTKPPCSGPSNWLELLEAATHPLLAKRTSLTPVSVSKVDVVWIPPRVSSMIVEIDALEPVLEQASFKERTLNRFKGSNWYWSDGNTALWRRREKSSDGGEVIRGEEAKRSEEMEKSEDIKDREAENQGRAKERNRKGKMVAQPLNAEHVEM